MSKESDFFVYLLEHYANYKNTTAEKILKILDEKELTDYVYDMYEIYHSESLDNAFNDIDSLIEKGKRHGNKQTWLNKLSYNERKVSTKL